MTPDERAVRSHLDSPGFQAAVTAGRWRVVDIAWPFVTIAVSAAPRPTRPEEFALRFELTGYPQQAPTATPWDLTTNAQLAADRRPRGEGVAMVFRTDWENGRALYVPFDRVALSSHSGWVQQHPGDAWTAKHDLSFFVRKIHAMLNDDEYLGAA